MAGMRIRRGRAASRSTTSTRRRCRASIGLRPGAMGPLRGEGSLRKRALPVAGRRRVALSQRRGQRPPAARPPRRRARERAPPTEVGGARCSCVCRRSPPLSRLEAAATQRKATSRQHEHQRSRAKQQRGQLEPSSAVPPVLAPIPPWGIVPASTPLTGVALTRTRGVCGACCALPPDPEPPDLAATLPPSQSWGPRPGRRLLLVLVVVVAAALVVLTRGVALVGRVGRVWRVGHVRRIGLVQPQADQPGPEPQADQPGPEPQADQPGRPGPWWAASEPARMSPPSCSEQRSPVGRSQVLLRRAPAAGFA